MSSPCWSLPHLLSSSPQHEAPPGQHETTLYTENLFQKLHFWKATLKNRSRTSITSVTETCEQTLPQVMSSKSLRPKSLRPKSLRPKSLRQFLEVLWKTLINYTMCRENLENKINKLQLLKKWRNLVCLNLSRHKAYSITRWQRCHLLRRCPTSSPRCTPTILWKALWTLISKMESYKSCWLHHCMPKELLGNQLQWSFRREK